MCLQCVTKAVTFGDLEKGKHDVLPGYALMQATQSDSEWKAGQYGLVRMNDPDVVWTSKPIKDPAFGLSDEELDNLSPQAFDAFDANCVEMEEAFLLPPMHAHALVEAAMKAGYDPDKHGFRFVAWLQHHLATWIEEHPALTPEQEEAFYKTLNTSSDEVKPDA